MVIRAVGIVMDFMMERVRKHQKLTCNQTRQRNQNLGPFYWAGTALMHQSHDVKPINSALWARASIFCE